MNNFLKNSPSSISKFHDRGRRGQTMLLMVLVLTASLLSVAMISGLVMLFQIRQSGDFTNSAEAIFAAEAGAEWWRMFKQKGISSPDPVSSTVNTLLRSENDSSFEIFPVAGNPNQVKIVGTSGNSKRALLVTVQSSRAVIDCPAADIMLVLDRSNSVYGFFSDIENAAYAFIDKLNSSPSYNFYLGIVSFGSTADLNADLRYVPNNVGSLRTAVTFITTPSGLTNLGQGILRAHGQLESNLESSSFNRKAAKDFIVIVTDGKPTTGSAPPAYPDPHSYGISEAQKAKADTPDLNNSTPPIGPDPIDIITIHVGQNDQTAEDYLKNEIASTPNHYYNVATASGVEAVLESLVTCP